MLERHGAGRFARYTLSSAFVRQRGKMGRRMDNIAESLSIRHTQGFLFARPPPHRTKLLPLPDQRPGASPAVGAYAPAKLPLSLGASSYTARPQKSKKTLSAKSHGSDLLLVFSLPLLAPRGPRVMPLPSRGMVAHTRCADCWPAGMPRPTADAPRRQRRESWRRRWERRAARRRISICCPARESAGREEEYEWDTARCWRLEAGRPQRLH